MSWNWGLAWTAIAAWIVASWFKYQKALARVHHLPGTRVLLNPYSPFMFMLPRMRGLGVGSSYAWETKYSMFDGCKWDIHTMVGILSGIPGYYVSNLDTIRQMATSRTTFTKPVGDYGTLNVFGPNLVASEGDKWKRQRRICAPAFSDRNNNYVWSTTTDLADEMMATWTKHNSIRISDICEDMTAPLALCVIAKAGFGQEIKWADNVPPPSGHKLTFKKALNIVTHNIFLPVILPDWAWKLRKHWRFVKEAYDEVLLYLNEMIDSRRNPSAQAVETPEKHDLFSQLLDAHDTGDKLTAEELIGNIFVFLIAGHETTSHTLGFLFGLLALYPEEQDRLVQHIEQNRPKSRDFTYEDIHKLTYVTATLYETLRLYPSVISISRHAPADTQMNIGSGKTISVPAATRVGIHVPGIHYNPKYWDDPYDFAPLRFQDPNWNREAFIPFAVGPRACIGRRFAETTVVALLARLLPRYRVSVDEELFKSIPGESMVDRRERFMKARSMLTLGPGKLPLVFTPRD
ncbi:hypothetical protein FRC12_007664 [Ceratobasidium sp. 428]|nr:hypothetical protein FRC12_007664 [Ceratobasidium sp. 428]